jgi:hypothetical protein
VKNLSMWCALASPALCVFMASGQITGPSTLQGPYLLPSDPGSGVSIVSIASNGNGVQTPDETHVNLRTGVEDYRLVGLPDGLGVYQDEDDLKNGTFTILSNHEVNAGDGIVRFHGNKGALVSYWKVRADPANLEVLGGKDFTATAYLWNAGSDSYDLFNANNPMPTDFGRFCAADLAESSAYRFGNLGTDARILLNGEEIGAEGRGFAHVATGAEAGTSWEVPWLGKFSWENGLASPHGQTKTVVIGTDDATPGNLYLYVGTKQANGTAVERAGLTNGILLGMAMEGTTIENGQNIESRDYVLGNAQSGPVESKAFTTIDFGDVETMTGAELQSQGDAQGQMNFLRPEDAAWSRLDPDRFYFVTTDSFDGHTRVWAVDLADIGNPAQGGTVTMLGDGLKPESFTTGFHSATGLADVRMMDNFGVSRFDQLVIQEDVGNNPRLGRIWVYDAVNDSIEEVAIPDAELFEAGGGNFLTQDEESSGITDAWDILGPGWWIMDMQGHYSIPGELVQGGQLLAIFIPQTASAPCYADFTGEGDLDLFDFLEYVNVFNAGDGLADCTHDGELDLFDFLCYVNVFNAGCP